MSNELYTLTKTYDDLFRYEKESYSISYCLSEFIDNSISSCELTYWNKGIAHDLLIEITYNQKNKTYIISDNAGGMSVEELKNAMIIGNKDSMNPDNSLKNQYGIGMKSAIFWIGKDAKIYSKKEGYKEVRGDYRAKNKKNNQVVQYTCSEIEDDNNIFERTGTTIVIYDVYSHTRPLTDVNRNEVEFYVGNRYSYYLSKNNCKIRLNYEAANNTYSGLVSPITISNNPDKVSIYKNIDPDKESLTNILDEVIANSKYEDVKKIKNDSKFEEFREKFVSGKELSFDDKIFIPSKKNSNKKYEADVNVYILNEAKETYSGVGIIHSNRYIYHPVVANDGKKKVGGMLHPFRGKFLEDRWKWVRVDLDIAKIEGNTKCLEIFPNSNKTELTFNSNGDIEVDDGMIGRSFYGAFKVLLKKWVAYANIVKDYVNKYSNNKSSNKTINTNSKTNNSINVNVESNSFENQLVKGDIRKFCSTKHKTNAELKIVDYANNNIIITRMSDYNDSSNNKNYSYEYNKNNKFFEFKNEQAMTNVLKLLLYLDINYRDSKIIDKELAELIAEAMKFWDE